MAKHRRNRDVVARGMAALVCAWIGLACGSSSPGVHRDAPAASVDGPAAAVDAPVASMDVPAAGMDVRAAAFETANLAFDGALCEPELANPSNAGHQHTTRDCDPVTYATNPPSSGTHYPSWAAYGTYATPVPWGFLVHDLEHGAIVIVYNCPEGCADEVAQAQALIRGLPPDARCGGAPMRVVLAPDPGLDTRWAASAWTWTLRAPCFDPQSFAAFIVAHYQGPDTEAACGGGLDLAASGWCP